MSDVPLEQHSQVFPAPALVDGKPVDWNPTSHTVTEWGSLRVYVNGEDVSYFRGTPVQIESLSWADPFGDETAVIRFPQITPYDELGVGDLDWLTDWCLVQVKKLAPDGTPEAGWFWQGLHVEDEDASDTGGFGLTLNAFGLIHQMQLYLKRPDNDDAQVDVGKLLFLALWQRLHKAYRFDFFPDTADPDVDAPVLGVTSNYRGNWEGTDVYAKKLLEMVPNWTITLDEDGVAQIVARKTDLAAVLVPDWTIRCGQPGVTHRLVRSMLLGPNTIYGTGTDTTGSQWRNLFAFDDGTPVGAVWYQPVAYDPEVNPYDEDGAGDVVFVPDRLDDSKIKFESLMDFGQGVEIPEAKIMAADFMAQMAVPGYVGNINLEIDPAEGHRLDMRPNQVLAFQSHRGADRKLFISRMNATFSGGGITVEVTVDEKARSSNLVQAIQEGNRQRVRNPVPQLLVGHRAQEDSTFLWDRPAGSGQIPNDDVVGRRWIDPINRVHALPDEWTVYRFFASERDTIISTLFDTDPISRFHVSIYNIEPNPLDLPSDPYGDGAWDEPPEGFIIGWGSFEQGAGYWPGLESEGGAITGVLKDEGVWQFTHDAVADNIKQPAFLWVAFWADIETFFGGELIRGVGQQL